MSDARGLDYWYPYRVRFFRFRPLMRYSDPYAVWPVRQEVSRRDSG